MEWLVDLVAPQGRTIARVLNARGNLMEVDLTELHSRGLRTRRPNFQAYLQTDFSELRPTDVKPELAALGLANLEAVTNKHVAYCLQHRGTRMVIPALTLMRSIFVPPRLLLPEMFRAHSLERMSYLVDGRAVIIASWGYKNNQHVRSKETGSLLHWMWTTDAGRKTADSVHVNAVSGKVDIACPAGVRNVSLRGVQTGDSALITEIQLTSGSWTQDSLVTGELPMDELWS